MQQQTFIISYDLVNRQDYLYKSDSDSFIKAIKNLDEELTKSFHEDRLPSTTYLIKSTKTTREIYDALERRLEKGDRLLIAPIKASAFIRNGYKL